MGAWHQRLYHLDVPPGRRAEGGAPVSTKDKRTIGHDALADAIKREQEASAAKKAKRSKERAMRIRSEKKAR